MDHYKGNYIFKISNLILKENIQENYSELTIKINDYKNSIYGLSLMRHLFLHKNYLPNLSFSDR